MNDPIADLMTRIRNAGLAQHESTRVPMSKVKIRVVEILKEEGFIEDFSTDDGDGIHKEIIVHLRYKDDNKLAINKMRKMSTPGRRMYMGAKDIPKVKNGLGVSIVSTSKGIITDRDARRLNVGGEVLCEIW